MYDFRTISRKSLPLQHSERMEKITEKLLLEKGSPNTNKLEQIKTLNLSRLGLKVQDLPVALLSRLRGLERWDLSGNSLQQLPRGLALPALRFLDLSNNSVEDVGSLDSLTGVEELNLDDNLYITVSDKYKLMTLMPKLRIFDGKDISTTANHMRYVYSEHLRTRIVAVWESSFCLPDPATAEKMAALEKNFISTVRQQVKYGQSSISDYTKWRVEMIAKEYLRSLTEPKGEDIETPEPVHPKESSNATTPVKRQRPTSSADTSVSLIPRKKTRADTEASLSEASPRKSSRLQLTPQRDWTTTTTASPRKTVQPPPTPSRGQATKPETPRRSLREQQPKVDSPQVKQNRTATKMDPKVALSQREVSGSPTKKIWPTMKEPVCLMPVHILQCHSKQDSPDDFTTQLWGCAFQPPLDQSACAGDGAGGSRIVATCGGDSVCLIDCETGMVMKKYKVPCEEFYSLAWSTVLMSGKSGAPVRPCSILAAGGKRGLVKLIHPRANMAYGEFRASRRALSVLHFSPRQGNFLFTGAYDNKIVMWDIGGLDSEYNFKAIQLLVLETSATALHICLPPDSPDTHLLAACEDGLHCYNIQLSKNTMKRSEEMEITFPIYQNEDKDHNYHTIDGLRFLTDDIVASKSHMQSSIYLWSWSSTQSQRPSKRTREVSAVVLAELQWSNTDVPFLALNTCPGAGYVVCGDDEGRLWTYHITDLEASCRSEKLIPATEVLEWPSPVRKGQAKVEGPSINSVTMDPEFKYLVSLTDKNMVVVWKREESP